MRRRATAQRAYARVPELPEVEAWVRALDPPVLGAPVARAGPAHIATLKTFDPPLRDARGPAARRRARGAASDLLFPTDDGELVLRIHLMSAGRIRYLPPGAKGPKTPAFRLALRGRRRSSCSPRPARRSAPASGSTTPEQLEAELAHLGPDALGLGAGAAATRSSRGDNRRLHSLLRDQRALAGIGRAHANEILHRAQLSPFALSSQLDDEEIERLAPAIDEDLGARTRAARAGQG